MSTGWAIGVSVLLLIGNAFFVGAEFAVISARRSVVEPMADAGNRLAKITLGAMEQVSLMLAGAQLGITICSLGLGYLGEPAIAHVIEGPFEALGVPEALLHPLAFAVALSIVSVLHIVLGEMVPKNIALAGPERAALVLAPVLLVIVRVLRPAIASLNWIANRVLRIFGVEPKDEVTSAFTRDEVSGLVEESHREGLIDQHEEGLLVVALTFQERDARSVLLPVNRLETVAHGATPTEIESLVARTGFSRFPVCRDGRLEGYLHLKDVLDPDDASRDRPIAQGLIRDLPTVALDDRLRAVLATMQRSGAHLARVEDAAGEVAGVVALEDVLEELVGEIRDEASAAARG